MPFIVQCPHDDCRKFMLLEDESRGTMVDCLLCKKQIKVDASKSGNAPSPAVAPPPRPQSAAAPAPAPPSVAQQKVVTCPNPGCQTPLRLAAASPGQAIRCPKCNQVFKI